MDKLRNLHEYARDHRLDEVERSQKRINSPELARLMHGDISTDPSDPLQPPEVMEDERRLRREIANSNERRRMQSINAGFTSLRKIIPCQEGEKVSKAAILQQTVDYINDLELEKTRLLTQTTHLKHLLSEVGRDSDNSPQGSPPPKRKKRDTESSDEGISLGFEDQTVEDLRKELIEIRMQLDRERRLRVALEECNRNMEAKLLAARHPLMQPNLAQATYRHTKVYFKDQLPRPPMVVTPPVVPSTPLVAASANPMEVTRQREDVKYTPQSSIYAADQSSGSESESSMSRRNLETIVEAIRHLEGEHALEDRKVRERQILHIVESEKDSSSMTTSDPDDCRSDSSGRDSPISYRHVPTSTAVKLEPVKTLVKLEPVETMLEDRYPIASQLLQPRPINEQTLRPNVIVQTL